MKLMLLTMKVAEWQCTDDTRNDMVHICCKSTVLSGMFQLSSRIVNVREIGPYRSLFYLLGYS